MYVVAKLLKTFLKKFGTKNLWKKNGEAKPSRRKIGFLKAKITKKFFCDYGGVGVVPGSEGDYGGVVPGFVSDYGG